MSDLSRILTAPTIKVGRSTRYIARRLAVYGVPCESFVDICEFASKRGLSSQLEEEWGTIASRIGDNDFLVLQGLINIEFFLRYSNDPLITRPSTFSHQRATYLMALNIINDYLMKYGPASKETLIERIMAYRSQLPTAVDPTHLLNEYLRDGLLLLSESVVTIPDV